jgi:hypothetical protein
MIYSQLYQLGCAISMGDAPATEGRDFPTTDGDISPSVVG